MSNDDAKFAHAVEVAARELFEQCTKDLVAQRTWDNTRPARKQAYRQISRRMLVAVLAAQRQEVASWTT